MIELQIEYAPPLSSFMPMQHTMADSTDHCRVPCNKNGRFLWCLWKDEVNKIVMILCYANPSLHTGP